MKVSSSSKKEPSTKVKQLAEKLAAVKAENIELKKLNRQERKKTREALKSRDKWKDKNGEKRNKIKGLQKKLAKSEKPKRHHYGVNLIGLCILLRIIGGCSYRSIPRILEVVGMCFEVPWDKTPCANSIKNWVAKMGYHQMEKAIETVQEKSEKVCLILDENLRIGNERMLLMMITPSERLNKKKEKALSYQDVEVIYMCGKKSWTGEKIEEEVKKLIEEKGLKVDFILSDEDSKLRKTARLLDTPHLPDIGHAIGSCLRRVFEKNEAFKSLTKLCGQLQSKSVHQNLTYLRPPKQRVKARFMNLKPLVKWGITMCTRFEELSKEEQFFFQKLKFDPMHQTILNTLNYCIELSDQISVPLKNKGLSQSTLSNFKMKIVDLKLELEEMKSKEQEKSKPKIPMIIELVEQYLEELEKYEKRYEAFLNMRQNNQQSYPVSSDIIECIFGKHKNIVSSNGLVGMTILDLELPVYCKDIADIKKTVSVCLEDVFMSDLWEWRTTHSSDNQAIRRKIFFEKRA